MNAFGWGPFSTSSAVKASQSPAQMVALVTSIAGNSVQISWTNPDIKGDEIIAYNDYIQNSQGTYVLLTSSTTCDGSSASIVLNKLCLMTLAALQTTPFDLQQGNLVRVKIEAVNNYGTSLISASNSGGALIETVPHMPTQAP